MSRIAIVTGGSRGIGAATARLLGADGWTVCINYRSDEEAARAVARDVEAAGGKALVVQGDTGDEADVLRLFETVDREAGRLTALVNNAAVSGPRGPFERLERGDMARALAVNVKGCMLAAREAVRRMSTRHGGQGGAIVNVSSGNANSGAPGDVVLYSATKGALNSLTIGLSQEVAAEGIRVNTVSPGLTETDMPEREKLAGATRTVPMGRPGRPEEVAEGIVWLLSDRASYVAGANLRIGGGRP